MENKPKTREELAALTQKLITSLNSELTHALHVSQAELDRMCIGDVEDLLEKNGGFKITAPQGNRHNFCSKEEKLARRKKVIEWIKQ